MVFRTRVYLLVVFLFILPACDSDPQATALSKRWSQHDWSQNQPELLVDINNDGIKERAMIGIGQRTLVVVAFLQNDVNKMDFVELFLNKPNQSNSICGVSATLRRESQKFKLPVKLNPEPQGYRSCPECEGVRVVDDQACDPFHIYWDHNNQMLSWWRY